MATRREKKSDALPDSVEDGTNIGRRYEPGESIAVTVDPASFVPPKEPIAATAGDDPIDVPPTTAPTTQAPDTDLLRVRGNVATGVIAIAEVNRRHPGGEAVVVGTEEKSVARTQRVMSAIYEGNLIAVGV